MDQRRIDRLTSNVIIRRSTGAERLSGACALLRHLSNFQSLCKCRNRPNVFALLLVFAHKSIHGINITESIVLSLNTELIHVSLVQEHLQLDKLNINILLGVFRQKVFQNCITWENDYPITRLMVNRPCNKLGAIT